MKKQKFCLIFLILLTWTAMQAQKKKHSAPDTTKYPLIVLLDTVIQIGALEHYGDGILYIKIENKGEAPLLISNCTGSCACTIATCPKEYIPANASIQMKITHETYNRGPFESLLYFSTNDPKRPKVKLKVIGEIVCLACPKLP